MMKALICCFPALLRVPHSIPTRLFWEPQKTRPRMQPSSPCRVSDLGPQLCVSSSCLTPVDRTAAYPQGTSNSRSLVQSKASGCRGQASPLTTQGHAYASP